MPQQSTDPRLYLEATATVESTHPDIRQLAHALCKGCTRELEIAKRLFLHVRDKIIYNPIVPFFDLAHYRASVTLKRGNGYCVQKAVLLAALARACRLPAALVFADIRNHLASKELQEMMGTNLFVYHAYTQVWIENRPVQLTPAFNEPLCLKHGFPVVDFNDFRPAIFPPLAPDGRRFVDYVRQHGLFADVPMDDLLQAWVDTYGSDRVESWKAALSKL